MATAHRAQRSRWHCTLDAARSIGIVAAAAFLVGCFNPSPARAGVLVHGDVNSLRVDASNASVAEVMTALSNVLKIRYHTATPLEGVVNGSVSGNLTRVLSSVLDDYNYVVKTSGRSVEVAVISRHGVAPVRPVAPIAPIVTPQAQAPTYGATTGAVPSDTVPPAVVAPPAAVPPSASPGGELPRRIPKD